MADVILASETAPRVEPVFSDAVAMLRKLLLHTLSERFAIAVPISSRRPAALPARFLRVLLVGGSRKNKITISRTFAVEAWAAKAADAVQLTEAAYAALHSLENTVVDGIQLGRVEDLALPADLPDPDTEHSRFTFTIALDMSYTDTI